MSMPRCSCAAMSEARHRAADQHVLLRRKPGRAFDDFRPEVHDFDGLLLADRQGERIWRPLGKPPRPAGHPPSSARTRVASASLQRDRSFRPTRTRVASTQRRPSAWVEPSATGARPGSELVEIPTDKEIGDNIVVFWVTQLPASEGEAL